MDPVRAEPAYSSANCVIPVGDSLGWEAAVFDHYQAMVTAICGKLQRGTRSSQPGEWIGGSTYHFDVWRGHPLHDEVLAFLHRERQRAVDLRQRVEAHNEHHTPDERSAVRVVAYVGQTVLGNPRNDTVGDPEEDEECES
jgi:hypothetical protein